MKLLALIVVPFLLSGMANGTFELEDPAQKIFEDKQKGAKGEPLPKGDGVEMPRELDSEGVGATACSEFLTYRQERSIGYWSSLYWLQGFINGAGYQRYMTLDDSRLITYHNTESMALWIVSYCSENPPDNLAEAAVAFVKDYIAEDF